MFWESESGTSRIGRRVRRLPRSVGFLKPVFCAVTTQTPEPTVDVVRGFAAVVGGGRSGPARLQAVPSRAEAGEPPH